MELHRRFGWLRTGRFLRPLSVVVGLSVLGAILYNATLVDRVPPTCSIHVSSTSADGKALTQTAIDIDFSKDVRHDTAENAFSISPAVDGSLHWQGLKLIWTPSAKLPLSTTFHVRIAAGVVDTSGNLQAGAVDLTFTTVGLPAVVSASPAPNASDVPVDAQIAIGFDRLMDTQKVLAGLHVQPALGFSPSWNGTVLTLMPTSPMNYATQYRLTIGDPAVDTDGTRLPDYEISFTTVGIGLHVTSIVPAPGVAGVSPRSQIALVFDGPLDPSSVADAIAITPPVSGSVQVATFSSDQPAPSPGSSVSASPTAAGGGNVLVFKPDSALAAHTTYSVTLSSTVRRTDGEAATRQAWTFTTGERTANALNQIAFISDRSGVANVWLMNPDGSNQREVTSELQPVTGFDVSGDGATIAYGTAGVIRKMSIGGDGLTTLTAPGFYEYAPTFTPNGTAIVVGRRDATGADLGYWLIPLISGTDPRQLTTDGAPPLGSASESGDGLTGKPGVSAWAPRAEFSPDGSTMLLVRGSDELVEVVAMAGSVPPVKLQLLGNSRGVWLPAENAFFVAGSPDAGTSWAYWEVTPAGAFSQAGLALGELDSSGEALVYIAAGPSGRYQVEYADRPGAAFRALTSDPAFLEATPSFSPDGATIVFGRVEASNPTISAGIWTVRPDGTGLTNLAVDGAFPRWLP